MPTALPQPRRAGAAQTALALKRALALALAMSLGGCTLPPAPDTAALEGRTWSLVALRGQALPALPLAGVPQIELREGRVGGSGGCNRLSGRYTVAGEALRFGPLAATKMMCPQGMALENDWLAALPEVRTARLQDDQLRLLAADGSELARLGADLQRWDCGALGEVLVRPQGSDAAAGIRLAAEGREHTLRVAPAASGTRHVVEQGRRPDHSMEWRTRGDEAQLLEAPLSDSRRPEDLQTVARCHRR